MEQPRKANSEAYSTNRTQRAHSIDSVNPSTPKWYVIYTKPRSEDMAREHLERKDVLVFLPKIRQVSFRKNSEQERIEPLFPSYIFARFTIPDEYYDVKWTRGVKRIVGNGQMPVPLDDSIVVFLKQRANEKGMIQPDFNLKEGDKVMVRRGPLQGLWGVIQGRVDARGRVRVLMDILRAGAKVEVPCSFLARHD